MNQIGDRILEGAAPAIGSGEQPWLKEKARHRGYFKTWRCASEIDAQDNAHDEKLRLEPPPSKHA